MTLPSQTNTGDAKPGRRATRRRPGRYAILAAIVLTGAVPLFGPAFAAAQVREETPKALSFEELFGDPVVVKARGLEIKESQIEKAFIALASNLAARGQRLPPAQRAQHKAKLLDRMIVTHLLTNRANQADVDAAQVLSGRYYADTKESAGSEESFLRQLKLTGLTSEQFNQRIFEQALAESVLNRELKSTLTVPDDEIRTFYDSGEDEQVRALRDQETSTDSQAVRDAIPPRVAIIQEENLSRLQAPERVRVSHIMISTRDSDTGDPLPEDQRAVRRQRADQLWERARGGEDFAAMVKEFSEDRNLAETGGLYVLSREDPYAPEFVAAAFTLQPGQISDVVATVFGFHIIKLWERLPPSKTGFEDAKSLIQGLLLEQKFQRALPAFARRLKQEQEVKILEEKYRLDDDSSGPALPSFPLNSQPPP